jgi:hypothetical protein
MYKTEGCLWSKSHLFLSVKVMIEKDSCKLNLNHLDDKDCILNVKISGSYGKEGIKQRVVFGVNLIRSVPFIIFVQGNV